MVILARCGDWGKSRVFTVTVVKLRKSAALR